MRVRSSRLGKHDLIVCFVCTVKASVDARKVTISGPKGSVTKDFSHVACEIKKMKQNEKKR